MIKKKNLLYVLALTIVLSGCGTANPTAQEETKTLASDSTKAETIKPHSDLDTSVPESLPDTQEIKSIDIKGVNLTDLISDIPECNTYHLLYDIALNPNAETNSDKNVTYMFTKDDNGNIVTGSVIAYYTEISLNKDNKESLCKEFVNSYFNELYIYMDQAEIHDDASGFGMILIFSDYAITMMPDETLSGITVIVSNATN